MTTTDSNGRDFDRTFTVWDVVDAMQLDKVSKIDSAWLSTPDWAGATYAEALDYATNGWANGAAALTEGTAKYQIEETPAFEYSLSDEGAEPDVAAYLAGEELNMGDMRRVPVAKPLVRIGVDMSVSCTVSAAKMLRVGESVFAAVERLRSSGYPTQVEAFFAVTSRDRRHSCIQRVIVQDAAQPVHAGLLAFYIAHPSALRRAFFAIVEQYSDEERRVFGFGRNHGTAGYGTPNGQTVVDEYDETAPSANASDEKLTSWLADIIERRS